MVLKKIPDWLKWGLSVLVLYILYVISIILFDLDDPDFFLLIAIFPSGYFNYFTKCFASYAYGSGPSCNIEPILAIVVNLAFYFVIGGIIGHFYKKSKNK